MQEQITKLQNVIKDTLGTYFTTMYKQNEGNKLSEELLAGMMIKIQGRLIENLTPLIIKKENK